MFRTNTGQTGRDAYIFEATAIANAQRELDKRFNRLLQAAHSEQPEMFAYSTDYHPHFDSQAKNAAGFAEYVRNAL